MNRALRRMSLAILAMFVLLLANVNYLQVFRVSAITAAPGNVRIFDQQFKIWRGQIVAAGDATGPQQVIAESRQITGGYYERHYPFGRIYAPVTGYDTPYTLTGIEGAEDAYLNGTAARLAVYNLKGLFTGKAKQGASVYLTISPKAQTAAYQALAAFGRPAAAVAIQPSTGAILAMASYPTFNPNDYATPGPAGLGRLARIDLKYRHDPSQPLLNRAINATYPPGSTFKIVTSSTAFGTGKVQNPNSTIPAPQFYHLPGSTAVLSNDYNSPCGDGHPPIIFAFTISCNTAFGKLGDTLGHSALYRQANLFGFNNFGNPSGPPLTVPMSVSPSIYPDLADPAYTALGAIGQKDDQVSPLQEAMLAATVANGGVLMRPYLISQVRAPDQSVVVQTTPTEISHVITSQAAGYLTTMMESVTHNPSGTAYGTAGPGVTSIDIAGKTGTAQNGVNNSGLDDSVFTSFAPATAGKPVIAVGVIVQGGGFGAAAAAPIAVKIIQAYLGRQ